MLFVYLCECPENDWYETWVLKHSKKCVAPHNQGWKKVLPGSLGQVDFPVEQVTFKALLAQWVRV